VYGFFYDPEAVPIEFQILALLGMIGQLIVGSGSPETCRFWSSQSPTGTSYYF
jgi:hypothetical protein